MKKAILFIVIMAVSIVLNMKVDKVETAIDSNEQYETSSFPIHPPVG